MSDKPEEKITVKVPDTLHPVPFTNVLIDQTGVPDYFVLTGYMTSKASNAKATFQVAMTLTQMIALKNRLNNFIVAVENDKKMTQNLINFKGTSN